MVFSFSPRTNPTEKISLLNSSGHSPAKNWRAASHFFFWAMKAPRNFIFEIFNTWKKKPFGNPLCVKQLGHGKRRCKKNEHK